MYLAPMNYNRFFERLFKIPVIAQRIFEDILDIKITEITPLPRKTKLTVDAAYVEFDYRCKIDGQYVILDMQQWYKKDVIKRFYMYDANNTSLQMETLKPMSVLTGEGKEYKTRDYSQIEPTTTIVWMVDDRLGYNENIVSFSLTPDLVTDFMRDATIWGANDSETLLKRHAELLAIMDNDNKDIGFLSKNKLMFVFQKNIVKSLKMAKYSKLFKFAEATKNPDNKEKDFEIFKDDQIFIMMIDELKVANLNNDDSQYITDYPAFYERNLVYQEKLKREAMEEAMEEVRKEARLEYELKMKNVDTLLQLALQEKQKAEQEKQKAEQKGVLETQLQMIKKFLKRGDSHQEIAAFLEIEPSLLAHYIALLEKE